MLDLAFVRSNLSLVHEKMKDRGRPGILADFEVRDAVRHPRTWTFNVSPIGPSARESSVLTILGRRIFDPAFRYKHTLWIFEGLRH